jgi:hypothetical protein
MRGYLITTLIPSYAQSCPANVIMHKANVCIITVSITRFTYFIPSAVRNRLRSVCLEKPALLPRRRSCISVRRLICEKQKKKYFCDSLPYMFIIIITTTKQMLL